MIVIIPPSTSMNMEPVNTELTMSTPIFKDQAEYLIHIFSNYSIEGLSKLFGISEELATKAYNEYRRFLSSEENKAAIFAFTGPVFKALDAKSLTYNEFHFAQNHVRILSSIYGVLKPLDAIKEYRSTFMIKEKELPEQNLFAFWKDKITDTILKDAKQDNKEILFLAFHDLLKCLDLVEIEKETRFVTVSFKEIKNGEAKIVREYEKIAIGHLLSHIIKNNINNIEDIKSWEYDEYKFNVNLSDNLNIVFSRETK